MINFDEEFLNRMALPSADEGGDVGGGGGSPEPASPGVEGTPTPDTVSEPSPSDSPDTTAPFALSDDVMYASDLDEIEVPETQQPAQPPAAKPQAPPAPPAQQAQPPAKPVAPQPVQQAQPSQRQDQGAAPPRAPSSPELLQQVLQNRQAIIGELASKRFALTPAEQEELETNAIAAIPKIAARTYFDAYTSAMHYINQQVPGMIATHIAEAKRDAEAESDFYAAWPGIDKTKHAVDVYGFAKAFRDMNPNASTQEAIQFAGSAVAAKYGLQNASKAAQPPPTGRTNSRARSAPFAPAAGGRTTVAPVVDNGNPWEGMGMNFDE